MGSWVPALAPAFLNSFHSFLGEVFFSRKSKFHYCTSPIHAVSTSAETWFVNCEFERNVVGNNGGAVLLEGGCPAGFFLNNWFKVRGVQTTIEPWLEAGEGRLTSPCGCTV